MLSISAVERETGLTKDVLRKWELRFGFPLPVRKGQGERFYSREDVDRLLVIKRLLDNGMRPSSVVPLTPEKLSAMVASRSLCISPGGYGPILDEVREALLVPDPEALKDCFRRVLIGKGLSEFVLAIMPGMNQMVGDCWVSGSLSIHQEHLYSEVLRYVLLDAIGQIPPAKGGRKIVLSTPPGERHDLGLLMVHAVFRLNGARCVSLGAETPAGELVDAAIRHGAHILALSFSIAFPARRVGPFLSQLRESLPPEVQLWAGGAGVDKLTRLPAGVVHFDSLETAALVASGKAP